MIEIGNSKLKIVAKEILNFLITKTSLEDVCIYTGYDEDFIRNIMKDDVQVTIDMVNYLKRTKEYAVRYSDAFKVDIKRKKEKMKRNGREYLSIKTDTQTIKRIRIISKWLGKTLSGTLKDLVDEKFQMLVEEGD